MVYVGNFHILGTGKGVLNIIGGWDYIIHAERCAGQVLMVIRWVWGLWFKHLASL